MASGAPIDWKALGRLWKDYKPEFMRAQHGKCAYCEFTIEGGAYGDVDHFRPKGAVDEMGVLTSSGEPRDRKVTPAWDQGYWWLAFDWKNFVLSCSVCNEGWKGALFPARTPSGGRHRVPPSPRRRETALLLNPFEIADVRTHISFTSVGQPVPLTEEGEHTISACGLFRQPLLTQRARLHTQVVNLLSSASRGDAQTVKEMADSLADIGGDAAPYAGAVRCYYETATTTNWPPAASVIGPPPP